MAHPPLPHPPLPPAPGPIVCWVGDTRTPRRGLERRLLQQHLLPQLFPLARLHTCVRARRPRSIDRVSSTARVRTTVRSLSAARVHARALRRERGGLSCSLDDSNATSAQDRMPWVRTAVRGAPASAALPPVSCAHALSPACRCRCARRQRCPFEVSRNVTHR